MPGGTYAPGDPGGYQLGILGSPLGTQTAAPDQWRASFPSARLTP